MASAAVVFLVIAGVIALGYATGRMNAATSFPDVAMLLLIGLALGPLNRILSDAGLGSMTLAEALHPDILARAAPYISGIALVVILFDAGLSMEIRLVRKSLGPAAAIAFPVFLVTVAAIASVGYWVFGMPAMVALVLGVALSNVGQTVSSALLRRMRLDDQTRAIGLVEMALYDIVSIPILVSLFQFASGDGSGASQYGEGLRGFAQIASVSLLVGAGAGFTWLLALRKLYGHPHSYMLTLAALLTVYAVTEELGGAGAVSVLLFGLCIGNRAGLLRRIFRTVRPEGEEIKVQAFHEEVTFLIRTLFFLFLGLSFTLGLEDRWPVDSPLGILDPLANKASLFALGAALVIVALPLARAAVIPVVTPGQPQRRGLIPVFGHGLGTAVLATLPFVWHDFEEGTPFHAAFAPWEPVFVNLAFLVILLSVLGSGVLVFLGERRRKDPPAKSGGDRGPHDKHEAAARKPAPPAKAKQA